MIIKDDEYFIKHAIQLAKEGMHANAGGPFGALVVKDGVIIGEGYNAVTSSNDPTAHAEVVAIRQACKTLGTFQLDDCIIYTSCEPCPMCLGAIYWARPKKVVYAGNRSDAAEVDFDDQFIYDELDVAIVERKIPFLQIMQEESRKLFKKWKEKQDKIQY